MEQTTKDFITQLSSKNPVPGGGGAAALMGAISAALAAMVANLTTGKKKYAEYEEDIQAIIKIAEEKAIRCLDFIKQDEEVFLPLSQAYGIPKDDPNRDEALESALKLACSVPFMILKETAEIADMLKELNIKGSRLAISDVAVSAAALEAALKGAAMNVFINTKLMKDEKYALEINEQTEIIMQKACLSCKEIYNNIYNDLKR